MRLRPRGIAISAAIVGLALAAAACGTASTSTATSSGPPVKGGTLVLLGKGDVDHLDTASAYYTVSYTLERAFTRQLVTYPASTNFNQATIVVADMATEVPTKGNGGVSSDGTTYTFHIRQGVRWDTNPSRQVTAQDVVLGFKRLCNPTSPVGAPGYYETTIVGFQAYCESMLNVQPTSAAIKAYIDSHDITGIKTQGSDTVIFGLIQPASDFLNILALPFASAAPAEYLQYVPDSADFRQHTISDGPYAIVKYDAGTEIDLDRNPAWLQSTDLVRHAYVDHIKITEALDQNSVQQQIAAGTADMEWDQPPPTAALAQLLQSKDSRLVIGPAGTLNPYMVINLQSPNNRGALTDIRVRQALEYAVNKVAVGQVYGGPELNTPASQIMFEGNAGYQAINLYPTTSSKGDAAKAKQLLAAAGWPNGITLKLIYRTNSVHPQVAQTLQASLKEAGINLELQPVPPADFYSRYLDDPANAKRGVWDIATPGWVPDWYGNDGRTMIQPLFDGRTYGTNTINYGDYNSPLVNSYIDQALSATTPEAAGNFWHQADLQIMKDAVVVPILSQRTPVFHSSRVENFIFLPGSQQGDVTNVWLKGA